MSKIVKLSGEDCCDFGYMPFQTIRIQVFPCGKVSVVEVDGEPTF